MNKKQLRTAIDYFLENNFQSRIKERGLHYFYDGKVTKLDLVNDKLSATVTGTTLYDVEVNLENLSLSHCTCPYENMCKHLVAVLMELKKLLDDAPRLSLQGTMDYHLNEPIAVMERLRNDLTPYIEEVYHLLSKSGHFSHEHTKMIVKQFYEELQQNVTNESHQFQIIAMTVLMDELYKKAINYETFYFRQNRFLAFFNELFHASYPALKQEVTNGSSFTKWYTTYLFNQLPHIESGSPYQSLISTWLLCEEREVVLLKHAQMLLKKPLSNHFFLTKLASLLCLQANDGARSIALLKELKDKLHHSDLIDHFLIMEQKDDFVMMKHWFELFFPKEKPKQGTVLGKLYEDMLVETGTDEEKLTIVWKNWLNQPSFLTYKSRMNKSNAEEKQKILQYIIPKLQADLYRSQTEATFYQIATQEGLFEEALTSLLTHKKETNIITPEIEKLLKVVKKQNPVLLLPFYHQLVERLVQKKSRVYYEEAALYIKQLKDIYEKINKQQTYTSYVVGLKQRFKTYRAFIQELKRIDK
ncbi:MAG: SWIM zinc finger domain-containing protein [Anaerobacillus sp.]|uniref:SWIM zinc finger family protein n=1 Tax=Anaerobacillus sp. TaxID=1872506 RepID=UPI003919ADE9